jgi:hypothetical protein
MCVDFGGEKEVAFGRSMSHSIAAGEPGVVQRCHAHPLPPGFQNKKFIENVFFGISETISCRADV